MVAQRGIESPPMSGPSLSPRGPRGSDVLPDRFATAAAFVLVAGACLVFLVGVPEAGPASTGSALGGPGRGVVSVMYDDGFYYLQIARNLASGRGPSFDGRHPTSGYHPLWLLALLPLAAAGGHAALLGSFLLQAGLAGAAAALAYRAARALGARPLAATLAPLALEQHLATYWMHLSGLEYSLQLALLCVLGLGAARASRPTPGSSATGALLCLARLDNALLVALVAAWSARRDGFRAALRTVLPAALAIGAYLACNLWLFGHALPISAQVKREWSAELLARDPVAAAHGLLAAKLANLAWPLAHMPDAYLLLPALGLAAALALLLGARLGTAGAETLQPFAAFAWLQLLAYGWLYHGGFSFQPWYFLVQPWLGALAVAVLAQRALEVSRLGRLGAAAASLGPPAVAGALLALTAQHVGLKRERQVRFLRQDPLYAAAAWVRDETPPGAVIGSWNAGLVAVISGRTVVNLDGLVNSWSYLETGRRDPCRYWREERVGFLVDAFDPASRAGGPAAGPCAAALRLVWTGPAYPGSGRRAMAFETPWSAEPR